MSVERLLRLLELAVADPSAAPVLHDALLERYGPIYANAIRTAFGDADAFNEVIEVRVKPEGLLAIERLGGPKAGTRALRLHKPFVIYVRRRSPGGSRPEGVITVVARPRWRPKATILFDGETLAYDPRTNVEIAVRAPVPGSRAIRWRLPDGASTRAFIPPESSLGQALDQALVRRVRTEIARRWSMDNLVGWHRWNDRNGDYRGMTRDEAVEMLMTAVLENMETPDEMRFGTSWNPRATWSDY